MVEFGDLPPQRNGRRIVHWDAEREQLKSKPNVWGIIREYKAYAGARYLANSINEERQDWIGHKGFTAAVRRINPSDPTDKRYAVWVIYREPSDSETEDHSSPPPS